MQTNPAVEQSEIIRWPGRESVESVRYKRKKSMEERICWRAKFWVQNEIL